jgi:hypothetical protein
MREAQRWDNIIARADRRRFTNTEKIWNAEILDCPYLGTEAF